MVLAGREYPAPGGLELVDEAQVWDLRGRMLERTDLGSEAATVTSELRRYQTDRFAEAWAGEPAPSLGDRQRRGQPTFGLRPQEFGALPKWAQAEEGRIVATPAAQVSQSRLLPQIGTLAATAAFLDFGLDVGLTGVRATAEMLTAGSAHLALHSLRVGHLAVKTARTTDPLKAYRAAAFAGLEVDYQEVP